MSLDAVIMLCGALVAFLSVAGFPPSFYKPMFFILGVIVIGLGIIVRRQRGERETAQRKRMHIQDVPDRSLEEHEMGL
jgi:hypothetical protein